MRWNLQLARTGRLFMVSVALSAAFACRNSEEADTGSPQNEAWLELRDRTEIRFPFTPAGPAISDVALGRSDELILVRQGVLEVYDTTGSRRSQILLPASYRALDIFGWRIRAAADRIILVHTTSSIILEYGPDGRWNTQRSRVLKGIHDAFLLPDGQTIVVAGVDSAQRSTVERLENDQSIHQILDSIPLIWAAGHTIQPSSTNDLIVTTAFPRSVYNLSSLSLAIMPYTRWDGWEDDALHARRSSEDFVIGIASSRGTAIFGSVIDSMLVTIETMPQNLRRIRVLKLTDGKTRSTDVHRAFNITDIDPANCRAVALEWTSGFEVVRVIDIVTQHGRCSSGARHSL